MLQLVSVIISALLLLLVVLTAIMNKQAKRIHDKDHYIFFLEETLTDALSGNIEKAWELRDEGIETVLERGRPDLDPPRQPTMPTGHVFDLTGVEEEGVEE